MHKTAAMKHLASASLWIAFTLSAAVGCVPLTNDTWTTTTVEANYQRFGSVEAVQEIVHRVDGNPAAGALVGAAVGAEIGSEVGRGRGREDSTLLGAAAGAIVGAAASSGSRVTYSYRVRVRFEDGSVQTFTFRRDPPLYVGDEVVLTPRGLSRA
jgi:outer membrane lipoprotein SlyB